MLTVSNLFRTAVIVAIVYMLLPPPWTHAAQEPQKSKVVVTPPAPEKDSAPKSKSPHAMAAAERAQSGEFHKGGAMVNRQLRVK